MKWDAFSEKQVISFHNIRDVSSKSHIVKFKFNGGNYESAVSLQVSFTSNQLVGLPAGNLNLLRQPAVPLLLDRDGHSVVRNFCYLSAAHLPHLGR